MNPKNKSRFVLWYVAVLLLAISFAEIIVCSPALILLHHHHSMAACCYFTTIIFGSVMLLVTLAFGFKQSKKLCQLSLASVICLVLAPTFLRVARLLDDGFHEYVVSGFIFHHCIPPLLFIAPILAVISLIRISRNRHQLSGTLFATVVIGLITIQFSIPLSVRYYYQLNPPKPVVCQGNLSDFYVAMEYYSRNNDNKWPVAAKWCDILQTEMDIYKERFKCPSDKTGPSSYAMNKFMSQATSDFDDDIVLLFESKPGWNQTGGPECLNMDNHKEKGCFVLFTNKAIKFVKPNDIEKLKWRTSKK